MTSDKKDSLWWLPWAMGAILFLFLWLTVTACSTTHRHIRRALPNETPEQSKAALQKEINNCTHKRHKK